MTGYFVTGTDTGVGKTYIACALVRRAVQRGHKVFAFKPIETGCEPGPLGDLLGADQELLAAAAGDWQTGPLRGVYRFPLPAAPRVAAEAAHGAIDLEHVLRTQRDGSTRYGASFSVIEGAGGWRVPITSDADMSTLSRMIGFPVIAVARAGLGTINHSLLTAEAVERDGQKLAAIVLSQRETDDPAAARSNQAEIRRRWSGTVLIVGSDLSPLDVLLPIP